MSKMTGNRMTTKPKPRTPPAADPILAAIAAHQAAYDRSCALSRGDDDDPEWLKSVDVEINLWRRLVATEPETLGSLAAFARHIDEYPDGYDEAGEAIATIAKTLRRLAKEAA